MKKAFLFLILIFAVCECPAAPVKSGTACMRFTIVLKKEAPATFIKDLDEVLKAKTSAIPGKTGRYNVRICGCPDKYNDYLLLFNNIPSIKTINGKPADPGKIKPEPPAGSYVSGEVLVKLKEGSAGIFKKIERVYGLKTVSIIKGINVYRVRIPEGRRTESYVKILSLSPFVSYAEPNQIYQIMK